MKLIFLGTPDFAVASLSALIKSRHEVLAVVTQPDKAVGRKAILTPSPVKVCAEQNGIKVLQYNKIRLEGVSDLKALSPDVMVTCAFGQILSQEIIDVAPHGVVNVHGSLLPKYRGAAPVQYAVLNGDRETGITIMQTEAGIDCGDILAVEKTFVGENETAGELFDRLSIIGARLIVETLDRIEKGDITPVKQDESKATYVKMIKKSDAKIDFSLPAAKIKNLVYGMNPWPIAWTTLNGKILKIYKCEILHGDFKGDVGEVIFADTDRGLTVKCGFGAIKITELQIEGGKRLPAYEFLLGRKIEKGDVLI